MRSRRRWIALALGVVLALAVAGYAGASYLVYDQMSAVAAQCGGRFASDTPASFFRTNEELSGDWSATGFDTTPYAMPDYREVSFPSRDARQPKLTIRAWWIPASAADAPAVIVVHGIGSCRHDPTILLPAGMLHRNGFSVLMLDMRDHGDSDIEDGRYAGGTEEYLDVLGGWDWLQAEQKVPASRIGLLGESLGAATTIIAMAEEPAAAALWEDSGFSDVSVALDEELTRNHFPTWLAPGGLAWDRLLTGDDPTARSPLDEMAKIGARPVAIVHGLDDTHIWPHHARDLAAVHARYVPGYQAWLVPGAGHVQSAFVVPQEYERRLVAFFRASLRA